MKRHIIAGAPYSPASKIAAVAGQFGAERAGRAGIPFVSCFGQIYEADEFTLALRTYQSLSSDWGCVGEVQGQRPGWLWI